MKGPTVVLTWLYRRLWPERDDRAALVPLWHKIIAIAREPGWYARGGVADTVPGRFDVISLVLALVLLRMEREAGLVAPAARLTELFVADMEGQLRESGMGDPTVGKQIGKLMSALAGRIAALRDSFAATDPQHLTDAVSRNASLVSGADPGEVAADLRVLAEQLDRLGTAELLSGAIAR